MFFCILGEGFRWFEKYLVGLWDNFDFAFLFPSDWVAQGILSLLSVFHVGRRGSLKTFERPSFESKEG